MTDQRILMPDPLPVERLLEFSDLNLETVAGEKGLKRTICRPELNRPALELAGFFNEWKPERVQILGTGEIAYLESRLQIDSVQDNLDRIFSHRPPCVVITNQLQVFDEIKDFADNHEVALFRSSHHSTRFIKRLWDHLEWELSQYIVRRGVLMDIFNLGVLISGPSSIGKSECALDLLSKGHTFVADDLILIRGGQFSKLIGTGHSPVPHHMEIRGIGIIDVYRMYGPRCNRLSKQVDMVIQLEDWDISQEYERLGMERKTTSILGIEIPIYTIPVKPGRNIGTIVEVAVLDCKMKQSGIYMAKEFDEKLIKAMRNREGR